MEDSSHYSITCIFMEDSSHYSITCIFMEDSSHYSITCIFMEDSVPHFQYVHYCKGDNWPSIAPKFNS